MIDPGTRLASPAVPVSTASLEREVNASGLRVIGRDVGSVALHRGMLPTAQGCTGLADREATAMKVGAAEKWFDRVGLRSAEQPSPQSPLGLAPTEGFPAPISNEVFSSLHRAAVLEPSNSRQPTPQGAQLTEITSFPLAA
jgi:hypothetical protein